MKGRFRAFFDGMTGAEQRVLIGLIIVATVAVGARHFLSREREGFTLVAAYDDKSGAWVPSGQAPPASRASLSSAAPPALSPASQKIDLNVATMEQIAAIPSLGLSKAKDIVDYRQRRGPFHSIEEVSQVPGVGDKTVERLRMAATVGSGPELLGPNGHDGRDRQGGPGGPDGRTDAVSSGALQGVSQEARGVSPSAGATSQVAAAAALVARAVDAPALTPISPDGNAPPLLDINTATAGDFDRLPGIGQVKAAQIVKYRDTHGPFKSVADLDNVTGIGAKTVENLWPYITCGGSTGADKTSPGAAARPASALPANMPSASMPPIDVPPAAQPQKSSEQRIPPAKPSRPARPSSASSKTARININTATQEELEKLPGVGPVLAQRIIAYRQSHGPFRSVADLEKVNGIGPKTRRELEPMATVSRP